MVTPSLGFDWTALMRSEWSANQLVVRCYLMLRADTIGFAPNPKILDLGDTRVAFFYGRIKYLKTAERPNVRIRRKLPADKPGTTDPAIELSMPQTGTWEHTPDSFYTLIATPASSSNPAEAVARVEETVGLLTTFEEARFVLEPVFEIEVDPGPPDTQTASSRPFLVPHEVKEADISDQRLAAISAVRATIDGLDEEKKNRLLLSLRWFESATTGARSSAAVDVFLAYWIALEALAMPDDTNIRPLNEALGAIYGIDGGTARTQFLTGKLYGLRSAIVHDGKRATITAGILRYLESLYVDLFFQEVGLPTERRAANFLASYDVEADLDAALA